MEIQIFIDQGYVTIFNLTDNDIEAHGFMSILAALEFREHWGPFDPDIIQFIYLDYPAGEDPEPMIMELAEISCA